MVLEYVKGTKGKLELYFLPGYARESNPDELVWSYVKRNGTAKRPLAPDECLQDRLEDDLLGIKEKSFSDTILLQSSRCCRYY